MLRTTLALSRIRLQPPLRDERQQRASGVGALRRTARTVCAQLTALRGLSYFSYFEAFWFNLSVTFAVML